MLEVMYYRGKKNTPELHEKYADRLERLAIDRFHTDCDVKQLKEHQYRGCPIYRAKLNQKARVLFVYLPIDNGTEKLFLLEFLENHEYEQSEFLNGKKLADAEKIGVVELLPSKEKIETEQQADSKPLLKFAQVHFYGNKKLELHKIQLEAFEQSLKQQRSAALVLGQSGSGKTVLAMALLLKGIREHGHTRVLYLTQEEDLCNTVRQKWANHPDYERYKENIECLQFIDFFKKQNKKFQWTPETSQAELEKWLEQHQHRKKFKLESYKFLTIYEEFRTISGYSKEEYCAVDFGKKRCLIQDRETREIFFKAYENWQQYLQTNKIILCDFSEIPEQEKYDVIAIDEIHDFSNLQILQLPKLTERLLCFGDSRQQLADNVRKTIFIQQCLAKHYKDIYEIELPMSHRCPNSIMQFSGAFETMRRQVMSISAKTDKPLLGLEKQGEVEWKTPDSPEADILLKQLANNADACIITLAGSLDKVRKKYPFFTQIFTPDRIKGLEYKHVVLVNFLEDERFRELNKCLKSKGFTDLDALLSACFVAATRPTESLTFLNEKENAQIDEVLRILHAAMAIAQDRSMPGESVCSSSSTSLVVPATVKESTPEEWEQQAKELIQKSLDNTLMVERILVEHLKMNAQEIDAWIAKNREPAVDKSSSSAAESVQLVGGKLKRKKKSNWFPLDDLLATTDEEFQKQLMFINDINKKSPDGNTLLHYVAAKETREKKLHILLKRQEINVNAQNGYGYTPLHSAVMGIALTALKALIKMPGIDVNLTDKEGRSAIHLAIPQADLGILELLLTISGMDINLQDVKNNSYLHVAVKKRPLLVGRLLNMPGIDVNAKDGYGRTPLFDAVLFKKKELVKLLLIAENIDADSKDNERRSPLMIAILEGDVEIVRHFLELALEKIDINYNYDGVGTYLHMAVAAGHLEIVKLLLGVPNIDVNLQDSDGLEPLSLAFKKNKIEIAGLLLRRANCIISDSAYLMIKPHVFWLKTPEIVSKINWNHRSSVDGSTPFMWLCQDVSPLTPLGSGTRDIVLEYTIRHNSIKKAMNMGGNTREKDNQNRTALFFACFFSNVGAMSAFLERNDYEANFADTFENLPWKRREILLKKMEEMKTAAFLSNVKTKLDAVIKAQQPTLVLTELFALEDLAEFERRVKAFGDINQKIFAAEYTLLSYACYKNVAVEKVQILLKMPGINVNYKDKSGYTALALAFSETSWKTIKLLLSIPGIDCSDITSQIGVPGFGSIDWNYRSKTDGSTPLMWICKIQCKTEQEEENKVHLAISLIRNAAVDITHRDNQGRTALFYACESNSVGMIRLFISRYEDYFQLSFNMLSQNDIETLFKNLWNVSAFLKRTKDFVAAEDLDKIILAQQARLAPKMILSMFENSKERSRSPSPEPAKKNLNGSLEMSKTS